VVEADSPFITHYVYHTSHTRGNITRHPYQATIQLKKFWMGQNAHENF